MLECEEHEIDCLIETHDEAGHRRLCQSDGIARTNLFNPKGNYRTARTHHIAVAGTAYLGVARIAALGHCDFLLDSLGDAHGIDRIGSLISRETNNGANSGFYCRCKHIVSTYHIGLDCLHREELTRWHLLQCCSMENIVDAGHSVLARLQIAHIADVELDLVSYFRIAHLIFMAHIILLLLIATKYTNFLNISIDETPQYSVAETSCTSGD